MVSCSLNMSGFVFPNQFVLVDTDPGVGKTVMAALLTLGLGATYWKPLQLGSIYPTDTEWVRAVTGFDASHFIPEVYKFSHPQSPHLASGLEQVKISLTDFALPKPISQRPLIIEAPGGVMAPLNEHEFTVDLLRYWNIPAVVVTRNTRGVLNQTLLTLDALRRFEVPMLGVLINGSKHPFNRHAIETYGQVSVIAETPDFYPLTKETLQSAFLKYFL